MLSEIPIQLVFYRNNWTILEISWYAYGKPKHSWKVAAIVLYHWRNTQFFGEIMKSKEN